MSDVKYNHVQVSKFLMKPFSHKTQDGKQVYYLDLKTGIILEEKINKLGTMPDYYYPETEEFLANEVESKVGDVLALIKKAAKNIQSIEITEEDDNNIKKLFAYTFLRSDGLKNETVNGSSYLKYLPEKEQIELILKHPNFAIRLFSDFFSNILINESTVNFVLPHNCVYSISSINKTNNEDFNFLCMPISLDCCVILIPNKHRDKYIKGNSFYGLSLVSDDIVKDFNNRALASERTNSKRFIIGDRVELQRLSTLL